MKIRAFTLAEVLITLGIIGVVSAMTIPNLATHIKNTKLKSQFKKAYAELNQATRTFYADTDIPVQDYDAIVNAGTVKTTSNNVLEKFMSYYKGYTKTSMDRWGGYDIHYKLKNLNMKGDLIHQYPCDQSNVFIDNVGRLYAMDDTPQYYIQHGIVLGATTGPKICVDINGVNKPNRWGYDRFVFVFTSDNAVIPYTGTSWNTLKKNETDEKVIAKSCSKTLATPAHSCAYFALNDKSPDGKGSYWKDFLK